MRSCWLVVHVARSLGRMISCLRYESIRILNGVAVYVLHDFSGVLFLYVFTSLVISTNDELICYVPTSRVPIASNSPRIPK